MSTFIYVEYLCIIVYILLNGTSKDTAIASLTENIGTVIYAVDVDIITRVEGVIPVKVLKILMLLVSLHYESEHAARNERLDIRNVDVWSFLVKRISTDKLGFVVVLYPDLTLSVVEDILVDNHVVDNRNRYLLTVTNSLSGELEIVLALKR